MSEPVFESSANKTLDTVKAIFCQRGAEYADSWHTNNLITTFLDATLAAFGIANLTLEQKRLLLLASLIDVKDSRMGGPFKSDSVIDGVAYRAAWLALREQFDAEHKPATWYTAMKESQSG